MPLPPVLIIGYSAKKHCHLLEERNHKIPTARPSFLENQHQNSRRKRPAPQNDNKKTAMFKNMTVIHESREKHLLTPKSNKTHFLNPAKPNGQQKPGKNSTKPEKPENNSAEYQFSAESPSKDFKY